MNRLHMGSQAPDVLVLGGGVIGCSIAFALRARGLDVLVAERGEPGGEASSSAGGILAPQAEAHEPGPLMEMLLSARAVWPRFAETVREAGGVDPAYRGEGTLQLALDEDELARLEARLAWQRARGLAAEQLSPAEVRALEPALGECTGALRFPDDHQVDNRLLVRGLRMALARAGVAIRNASARRVLHDGARATGADLDGSAQPAGQVVLACGAWSSLVDGAGLPAQAVVPLRGQMLELEMGREPLRHVVFGDGGYLVPRAGGRMLCGSTQERVGFKKEVTPAGLAQLGARAARLCPELAQARVRDAWSGLRPATADGLPFVGPSELPGLHLACGHHRNGILLAPLTAEIVAACVTGETPPVELAPLSPRRSAAGAR